MTCHVCEDTGWVCENLPASARRASPEQVAMAGHYDGAAVFPPP
jgi:hypothetical protein